MHIRWTSVFLAALMVLAMGCAKQLPVKSPLEVSPLRLSSGEWREVDQVFVVTDASGTMYWFETFPQAKADTQTFIAAMPEKNVRSRSGDGYEAASIGFGGSDRQSTDLAPFDRSALAANADQIQIMGAPGGVGGHSPYHNVFHEISAQLEGKSGMAAVVIFGDGLADYPNWALDAAKAANEKFDGTICFHAVQAGEDPDGEKLLRQLAELTHCGSYRRSTHVSDAGNFMDFVHGVFVGKAVSVVVDNCDQVQRLEGANFEFDRAEVTPAGASVLNVAVEWMTKCPEIQVQVEGHTDSIGTEEYNQGLSERRANSVKQYLLDAGIDASRMEIKGFGESRPIAPNESDEGRARNRRVDLRPM